MIFFRLNKIKILMKLFFQINRYLKKIQVKKINNKKYKLNKIKLKTIFLRRLKYKRRHIIMRKKY
jgi:hypothetical protein